MIMLIEHLASRNGFEIALMVIGGLWLIKLILELTHFILFGLIYTIFHAIDLKNINSWKKSKTALKLIFWHWPLEAARSYDTLNSISSNNWEWLPCIHLFKFKKNKTF